MTEAEVIAALEAHLTTALSSHSLTYTSSFEDAVARYTDGDGWLLVTKQAWESDGFLGQDNWNLLIQCSKSLQPGAQATTETASDADRALTDDLMEAVNDDDGFAALMTAGLFDPQLKAGAEDQQSESYINPHTFTCSTY